LEMAVNNRFVRAAVLATGVAVTAFGYAPRAHAAFIVTMDEVGSDVVLMGSGSIDTAGLTPIGTSGVSSGIAPATGEISIGSPGGNNADVFAGFSGPSSFGSGGPTIPSSSGNGDKVAIFVDLNQLLVPLGYVSGHALADTSTYTNATFATLGVTTGTYEWTWGTGATADSFTLQIESTPTGVPEPATTLLIGLPVAATMLARRRAKRLGTST
jgi:hypothetical protein